MKALGRFLLLVVLAGLVGVGVLTATNGYYGPDDGERCARCHEIRPMVDSWAASTHRDVTCAECHGSSLTGDIDTHLEYLSRWLVHRRGQSPEQIRVKHTDVAALVGRCATCHAEQHADWKSGPHGVTYSRLFLDKAHNTNQKLMDDCLRCHGMHYDGGIRKLVAPLDREGPWQLIDAVMYDEPATPCLACHSVHRSGEPSASGREGAPEPVEEEEPGVPSLAFFDRRGGEPVPVKDLPMPAMRDGDRLVDVGPDQRQALCYQCHAPRAGYQVFSGDDRTPTGVHEGLSCLACHGTHKMTTRTSCASCHAGMSNCRLDVETMDTTFRSSDSAHDIHRVACEDCHPRGLPGRLYDGALPEEVP